MSPGLLGGAAAGGAFLFSLFGLALAAVSFWLRDGRPLAAAQRAAGVACLSAGTAFAALEWALIADDFSVRYVAENHSTRDPLWVTLVTPWAALEGSILLWALLQSFYTLLLSRGAGGRLDPWRAPVALATSFGIQSFFFAVVAWLANPFAALPEPPPDGAGPNPLLQNHWMMAVHPVLMYAGFVGLAVPFAHAVAGMVTGRYQSWVKETRRWTLAAWALLTAAIFAGGWWSYEVLGWGGYWAWDPVENASLVPWLLATAFLHTGQLQEGRGFFRVWNFAFVTLAFSATILGTFLTRSGVIQSLHSFAQGPIGPVFLGFFVVVLLTGLVLLSRTSARIREVAPARVTGREAVLLGGAVLFATLAFVVVVGTVFPLFVEAFTGAKVSVGAPFFNQVSAPLWVAVLLLMGAGPVLPWRVSGRELWRNLLGLGVALVAGTVLALAAGAAPGPALAVGLFAYNVAAAGLVAVQGVQERRRATGAPLLPALWGWAATARRRVGSLVVHLGVALAALAIAVSQTYRIEEERTLRLGERWEAGSLSLTLDGLTVREEGNRFAVVAAVTAAGQGAYRPRLTYYAAGQAPLASPDIRYTPWTDYYLVLQAFDQERGAWATLRLVLTPMVFWLWVAGGLILVGALYILWPGVPRGRQPGRVAR